MNDPDEEENESGLFDFEIERREIDDLIRADAGYLEWLASEAIHAALIQRPTKE